MKKRIYYHDTDCGGIVYYANYLKFLEEARTEFFESKGISIKDLAEKGILFVVARQEIDYKSPAHYGDILDIDARLSNVGRVKIEFANDISRISGIPLSGKNQKGEIIASAKTVMVCIDNGFKPKTIPDDIRKKLL